MGLPIRYSPSGPPIGGQGGQPVELLVNQNNMSPTTIGTSQTLLNGSVTNAPPELYVTKSADLKVDNLYMLESSLTFENTDGSNPVLVTCSLELSYDGSSFFVEKSIQHTIPAGGFRTLLTSFNPRLGTDFATPMPSGASQLVCRLTALADNGSDAVAGPVNNESTYWLALTTLVTFP